jgi:hypothetical protein
LKKSAALTEDYAKSIEVGERKIRANIDELDQAVYGGKKVSRK